MAPFEDVIVPRKRITTYGKSARRRIPDYEFGTTSKPSEKKRLESHSPTSPSTSPPEPKKLKSVSRPSLSNSAASASASKANIFDVPTDNEARPPPAVKKPAKKQTSTTTESKKAKATSRASTPKPTTAPATKGSVFDVPIDEEARPVQSVKKSVKTQTATTTEPKKAKAISRASTPKPTTAPAIKSSVFDIPSDGEDRPLQPVKKPVNTQNILPTEPKKVKAISRASPPKATAASTSKANIFDVISSDDEEPLKSRPKAARIIKPVKNTIPKKPEVKQALVAGPEIDRRKRMKFSPVPISQKPKAAKSPTIRPITEESRHIAKSIQSPIQAGTTSTIVTRPKKETAQLRREERKPLRKPSPVTKSAGASTPPPPFSPIPDRMDIDSPRRLISPRGAQMWKELLDSGEDGAEDDDTIMDEGAAQGKPTQLLFSNMSHKPAGVTKKSFKPSPKRVPRRRLIDSLVEQGTYHHDIDDEMEDEDTIISEANTAPEAALDSGLSASQNELFGQRIEPENATVPALSATISTQSSGPKFTYSRQRSMLAEEDLMQQLALDMPTQPAQAANGRRPRRGSLPVLPPLPSFHDDDVGDDVPTTSVRSVHELRQAGANTRFLDEVEDLLDRIGKPTIPPSSMRRSGLLDLAKRLQDKNFVRQFRSNGVEQRMFTHLGQETDLIAGYMMTTALMTILHDVNMPHIVAHLRRQGITRLLIRMIELEGSIVALSKDRKSNMSKVAQSLILEQSNFILELPIWDDLKPRALSPKTAALKCLEMMVRQSREAGNSGDIISKELTTNLFSILKCALEEDSWNLPEGKEAIDFYLAVSTLESHSIVARTAQDESIWINNYLPIIAEALEIALKRPANEFSLIQGLILRLTLNVTNNNSKASDVFAGASLIASMGQIILVRFKQILGFMPEDELFVAVDYLVLVIAVMFNFAEWSTLARDTLQSFEGRDDDPLDSIVRLYVDNKKRASEAESLEESSKNVAFGYLSAMLGYLSLSPSISARIANQQPSKTLRPLLESIEEFIAFHKEADKVIENMEDGHNAQRGLTERLEKLVIKLKTPGAKK